MKRKIIACLAIFSLFLAYIYTYYLVHKSTKMLIKRDTQMLSGILYSTNIVLLDVEQHIEQKYADILYNAAISLEKGRNEYISDLDIAYYFNGKKTHVLKGKRFLKDIKGCTDTLKELPKALECKGFYLYIYPKTQGTLVVGVSKKRVEEEKTALGLNRFFNELSRVGFFFYVSLEDLNGVAYSTIDKRIFTPLKEDSMLLSVYIEGKEEMRIINILGKKVIEDVIPFSYGSFRGIMRVGIDGTGYFSTERKMLLEIGLLYIILFLSLLFSYKYIERAKKAEKGYETAKKDMEKRIMEYEALGRVIGEVSHAIKNPLNGIGLIVQSLNMEESKKEYEDILREVKRIEEELNRFVLLIAPVRLSKSCHSQKEIIKEVIASLGLKEGENIKVEGDVSLECDRNKIFETYTNIIKNAIEAKADMIRVYISDKDIVFKNRGKIPKEVIDKIFEPFFTTKNKGSGIGMYYVKKITEAHGWKVSVINTKEDVEVKIEFSKHSRC